MEHIFLGNEVRGQFGVDWTVTRQKARVLMARVGLQDEPDTRVKGIGVGKQQLVAIERLRSQLEVFQWTIHPSDSPFKESLTSHDAIG